MSFLLDTNIASAFLRGDRRLTHRFIQYGGQLKTSRIVLAELYAWKHGGPDPGRRGQAIEALLRDIDVLEFDDPCAERFGRLRATLRPRGITVPPIDLMIAATALVHGLTLVTHNTRDFAKVPGLTVEDWLVP